MTKAPIIPRSLFIAAGLVAMVVLMGILGYMLIEGWTWFEALYMTVTAVTTVGGGEAHPLSAAGRAFTLVVIVFGVGVMTYTALALVGFALEGQLQAAVGSRQVRRRVQRLNNHLVLCGFGRVGREIARQFAEEKAPFVVVDINERSLEQAAQEGHLVVHGNAANVDVLKEAGLERARGLVTAVDSDADNIYVTLSARVLRPNLFIVARANEPDAEPKLRLAGANRIISPYTIGGRRMANLAMRPTAVDFVDNIMSVGNSELLLEALMVPSGSAWDGKPLRELVQDAADTTVLAIKRGEQMVFRPALEMELASGDELVAAGPANAVRELEGTLRR